MRHDYDIPAWLHAESTTDEERHKWYTQERCRRQARRQRTPYSRHQKKRAKRGESIGDARNAVINLEHYR